MFHVERRPDPARDISSLLSTGAAEIGIDFPPSLLSAFQLYLRELKAWNRKTNLTAITEDDGIAVKHFLDSLACTLALERPVKGRLLDVGSGAGFPGLPLKLLHPQLDVALLEPSHKKTAFLRHMIGTLGPQGIAVVSQRVEDYGQNPAARGSFQYILTRAVKVDELLPGFRSLLTDGGRIILCRSQPLGSENATHGLQIQREIAYTLPRGHGGRVLTVLAKV